MIMNKYILLLMVLISSGSFAEEHDGMVNITGTIQDNTCEIAPDSQSKTVDMGTMAQGTFRNVGDRSAAKAFSIKLENCGPAASEATVTFSGTPDKANNHFFAIESGGEAASGIALGIYDINDKNLQPDQSSEGYELEPGQKLKELQFFARYVSVLNNVTEGSSNAFITFEINYS